MLSEFRIFIGPKFKIQVKYFECKLNSKVYFI